MDFDFNTPFKIFPIQTIEIQEIVNTILILITLFILRYFLIRTVKGKSEILDTSQRRWLNRINNIMTVFILFSLIFIWAPQLQSFALSVTAFSVAFVITTKELLMCLTGGFLRASVQSFDVGDWIQIDGITGEVMRINAMGFVIEEIEVTDQTYQFTGRTISVPNSKFLSSNVTNLKFLKHYIYYNMMIYIKPCSYNDTTLDILKNITEKYYAPHRSLSVRYNRIIERKTAVDFSDPEPQFFMSVNHECHILLTVRLFLPTLQAASIASHITADFLNAVYNNQNKSDTPHQALN